MVTDGEVERDVGQRGIEYVLTSLKRQPRRKTGGPAASIARPIQACGRKAVCSVNYPALSAKDIHPIRRGNRLGSGESENDSRGRS